MRRRHIVRAAAVAATAATLVLGSAVSALACGGLIAPNGTISLTRTSTLAAYHDGIEHYLTSFQFSGKVDGSLGSITPLPGVPTKVIKGGDWTLQRLELEVNPPDFTAHRAVRSRGYGRSRRHRPDANPGGRAQHHGPQGRRGRRRQLGS